MGRNMYQFFLKRSENKVTVKHITRVFKLQHVGRRGIAATIAVGETETLPPNSPATVENVGTENDAVFNFGIPQGEKGDPGEQGNSVEVSGYDNGGNPIEFTNVQILKFNNSLQVNDDGSGNPGVDIGNNPSVDTLTAPTIYVDSILPNAGTSVSFTDLTANNINGGTLSGDNTGDQDLSPYALTADLSTVAFTGDYNDLVNTPTGFVTGVVSSTNNALPRWDGTDGDAIKDSGVVLNDSNTMSGVNALYLSTSPTGTHTSAGNIVYNPTDRTYDMSVGNGVTANLPEELWTTIQNDTGSTIPDGAVVQFVGTIGASGNMRGKPAVLSEITSPRQILGIATENIANGSRGKVTRFGQIRGLNTTGMTTGSPIYLSSTPGVFTTTQPVAPNKSWALGVITAEHAVVGTVQVNTFNMPGRLEDMADINGTPLTANGQIPVWNQTNQYFDFTGNINNYVLKAGDTMSGALINSSYIFAGGAYSATPSTPGVYIGIPATLNARFTMVPNSGNVRAVDNSGGAIRFVNSTAGTVQLVSSTDGLFTFGSNNTPTHTITLPSTATGIALYNTTDQTTNYERALMSWVSNAYTIQIQNGGTGTARPLRLIAAATTLTITDATYGFIVSRGNTGISLANITSTGLTASSGTQYGLLINPTINQSSTAAYEALTINVTETATGSGAKNLLNLQVGSVSRFRVSNIGDTVISSAATSGLTLYNTSDEVTNYERVRTVFTSNVFTIVSQSGGTGTLRAIRIQRSASQYIELTTSAGKLVNIVGSNVNAGSAALYIEGTGTSSSGVQYSEVIAYTYNQSSTAGSTDLLINRTETVLGSGSHKFIDLQVGGVSLLRINNQGVIELRQAATASAPTYVKGGLYFDTTLNKLRVGGSVGWETVTSV